MVGTKKVFQGQVVQVVGQVNGDEVVVQLPDGSRQPVNRGELTDLPKAESNRPIITKGAEAPVDAPPPVVPPVDPSPSTSDAPPAPPADTATPPTQ